MTDTVGRLREAAEDLLLKKGQAATTLRDITDRAGANVASVSYHFGSKDALLGEVFGAVLAEATGIQQARLTALPDDAPLEDVVRVWLAPALPSPDRDPREARDLDHRVLVDCHSAPGAAIGASSAPYITWPRAVATSRSRTRRVGSTIARVEPWGA